MPGKFADTASNRLEKLIIVETSSDGAKKEKFIIIETWPVYRCINLFILL